jgi:hypothetical protein
MPVAHALEIAAKEWPGVPRSELITRLMTAGAQSVETARAERFQERSAEVIAAEAAVEIGAGDPAIGGGGAIGRAADQRPTYRQR